MCVIENLKKEKIYSGFMENNLLICVRDTLLGGQIEKKKKRNEKHKKSYKTI